MDSQVSIKRIQIPNFLKNQIKKRHKKELGFPLVPSINSGRMDCFVGFTRTKFVTNLIPPQPLLMLVILLLLLILHRIPLHVLQLWRLPSPIITRISSPSAVADPWRRIPTPIVHHISQRIKRSIKNFKGQSRFGANSRRSCGGPWISIGRGGKIAEI